MYMPGRPSSTAVQRHGRNAARCSRRGPRSAGRAEPYYGPVASPGYLRFPHVTNDLVVFVAADDVWLAPVAGGRAWRFAADEAQAALTRGLTPDGGARGPGSAPRGTAARRSTSAAWPTGTHRPADVLGCFDGQGVRLDGARRGARGQPCRPAVLRSYAGAGAVHRAVGRPGRRPDPAVRAGPATSPRVRTTLRCSPAPGVRTWRTGSGTGAAPRARLWLGDGIGGPAASFRRMVPDITGQLGSPMIVGDRLALFDRRGHRQRLLSRCRRHRAAPAHRP